MDGRRRWLGAAYSDGKAITFFGTGEPGGGAQAGPSRGGIWMATSDDGAAWRVHGGIAIAGVDPGAVPARDGGWIVSVTGPPRRGSPSAEAALYQIVHDHRGLAPGAIPGLASGRT